MANYYGSRLSDEQKALIATEAAETVAESCQAMPGWADQPRMRELVYFAAQAAAALATEWALMVRELNMSRALAIARRRQEPGQEDWMPEGGVQSTALAREKIEEFRAGTPEENTKAAARRREHGITPAGPQQD